MPTIETIESPLVEFSADHPSISISDVQSPSNYTYYPWTLPPELIPQNATSSKLTVRTTFDLSFPNMPNTLQMSALQRVNEGILVNSMSGLRLGMVREPEPVLRETITLDEQFRIYAIANVALGRDEKVYMSRSTIESFNPLDPYFTRTRDSQTLDLVIDIPPEPKDSPSSALADLLDDALDGMENLTNMEIFEMDVDQDDLEGGSSYLSSLFNSIQSFLAAPSSSAPSASASASPNPRQTQRFTIPGTLPIGPGSAPLPDVADPDLVYSATNLLSWSTVYIHPNTLCDERLPIDIPRNHQVIVIPRGDCSFSAKIRNIPAYPPKSGSLQLVVIVSYPEHEEMKYEFTESEPEADKEKKAEAKPENRDRKMGKKTDNSPPSKPTADKPQPQSDEKDADSKTKSRMRAKMSSKKPPRPPHPPIPQPLVQPFLDETQYTPSGLPRPHPIPLIMVSGGDETIAHIKKANAIGVRRRYYFLSQGVRIGNLIVL